MSKGWGKVVEELFSARKDLGVVGVAGGHLMPDCPASWFTCHTVSYNICQHNNDNQYTPKRYSNFYMPKGGIEVACVDGLWMCIRKELFKTIRFDEDSFDGFHAYDIDICMQAIKAGFSVRITDEVDIYHKSPGTCDGNFLKAMDTWHKKWHTMLPIVRGVDLPDDVVLLHQGYAEEMLDQQRQNVQMSKRLHSPEYRLGHFLLKPWRFAKRSLHLQR